MPGPFQQWLYLRNGDRLQEIVNGARTAAYLRSEGGATGIDLCSVLDFAGCEAYARVPAYVDSADDVIEDVYSCDTPLPVLEFSSPAADPAPWYSEFHDESEDAYGFYIEEWTGLDARHITRASASVGGAGSGVTFGPTTAGGRVQKINILLLAGTEQAMAYLFNWLSDTLVGSCSACATDYLLFKRWCDSGFGPFIGTDVGEQRRVALVEGLQWENDIEGVGKCLIRRASFTVTAGDPCIYDLGSSGVSMSVDGPTMSTCLSSTLWDVDRLPCRPSCSELVASCADIRYGDLDDTAGIVAPMIQLDNNYDTYSLPVRVTVFTNPNSVLSNSPDTWCGLPALGQIYVAPLPPYSRLTWDVAGRRILYRDITTGDDVVSSAFLLANDPPIPRWFTMQCPGGWVIAMEIGDLCMTEDAGELDWPAGGIEFTDPHYPDMDLLGWVTRTGCP